MANSLSILRGAKFVVFIGAALALAAWPTRSGPPVSSMAAGCGPRDPQRNGSLRRGDWLVSPLGSRPYPQLRGASLAALPRQPMLAFYNISDMLILKATPRP